jgi:hypothetical protein
MNNNNINGNGNDGKSTIDYAYSLRDGIDNSNISDKTYKLSYGNYNNKNMYNNNNNNNNSNINSNRMYRAVTVDNIRNINTVLPHNNPPMLTPTATTTNTNITHNNINNNNNTNTINTNINTNINDNIRYNRSNTFDSKLPTTNTINVINTNHAPVVYYP